MGDIQGQLLALKTQMQQPSQQPQSRDRRKQRDAKRSAGDQDFAIPVADRAEGSRGYDPNKDPKEQSRLERNQKWEGPSEGEGDSGDMRKSNFGYGPKSSYKRDDGPRKAPGTFLPDNPPNPPKKVDGIQSKKEQPEKQKPVAPEQIFQIHALADQLLSALHSVEIVLDNMHRLGGSEDFEKIKNDFSDKAEKIGKQLLEAKTLEGLLQTKLQMRKLTLDIMRATGNYDLSVDAAFKKDYDEAIQGVRNFGKEAEVIGTREVGANMVKQEAELELTKQTGLKILRPVVGTMHPNIPKEFKKVPLDSDDAARDSATFEASKISEEAKEGLEATKLEKAKTLVASLDVFANLDSKIKSYTDDIEYSVEGLAGKLQSIGTLTKEELDELEKKVTEEMEANKKILEDFKGLLKTLNTSDRQVKLLEMGIERLLSPAEQAALHNFRVHLPQLKAKIENLSAAGHNDGTKVYADFIEQIHKVKGELAQKLRNKEIFTLHATDPAKVTKDYLLSRGYTEAEAGDMLELLSL